MRRHTLKRDTLHGHALRTSNVVHYRVNKSQSNTLPWPLNKYATKHVMIRRFFLGRSWLWRVPSWDQRIVTSTWLHHYVIHSSIHLFTPKRKCRLTVWWWA